MLDKLDKIDKQIIEILKEDSSTSVTSIKKKIKLSETAIRNRILTLKQNGIIKKFTIEINQEQIVFPDLINYQIRIVFFAMN